MNVFVLIPTALKAHALAQIAKWKSREYKIGLFIDPPQDGRHVELGFTPDFLTVAPYPGVWRAWNALSHTALSLGADVCVLAGDDMDPDLNNTAEEIGRQYLERFPSGFGVMQPTGDRQGELIGGKWNSQRICGSPWVGREWIREAYHGAGPVCPDYTAFYADEELLLVAEQRDALWQRDDLCQLHRHWSFGHLPRQAYHERNQAAWSEDHRIFQERKQWGFP